MTAHFDVVVLGAGPGGYVAAVRAAQLGLKTAIIELKYWGGVCNNVGCIPTKSLLRNAEIAHLFTHEAATFGISGDVTFDFGAAFKRSRTTADRMAKGVHYLMKKNKVTEIDGWATFADDHTLDVELNKGGTDQVTFDNLILAVGATTRLLPGTSLSERVVTYEEQILTSELPGSIIIAGAGAIGVEFAYVLANYGVDVTIVEYLDRMVPLEEPEVSAELAKAYKKLGVTVLTSTKVETIDDSGDQVSVTVSPAAGGESKVLKADKVMQAIGFAPRTQGYGIEKSGIQLTERGAVEIDEYMRTNVPHIYAIGDCTGQAHARARGRSPGGGGGRDHRGGRDADPGLRDDARAPPTASRRSGPSATPSSRPRTWATTSRRPSSRSPPTARRTGWARRPASSSWWPTPSTARSSACT